MPGLALALALAVFSCTTELDGNHRIPITPTADVGGPAGLTISAWVKLNPDAYTPRGRMHGCRMEYSHIIDLNNCTYAWGMPGSIGPECHGFPEAYRGNLGLAFAERDDTGAGAEACRGGLKLTIGGVGSFRTKLAVPVDKWTNIQIVIEPTGRLTALFDGLPAGSRPYTLMPSNTATAAANATADPVPPYPRFPLPIRIPRTGAWIGGSFYPGGMMDPNFTGSVREVLVYNTVRAGSGSNLAGRCARLLTFAHALAPPPSLAVSRAAARRDRPREAAQLPAQRGRRQARHHGSALQRRPSPAATAERVQAPRRLRQGLPAVRRAGRELAVCAQPLPDLRANVRSIYHQTRQRVSGVL